MTDLAPFTSPLPSRLDRAVDRRLRTIQATTCIEFARVESLAQVTEAALLAVAHISAVEGCLLSATPLAEARLQAIADAGAVGLQSIVLRHARGSA